MPALDQHIAAAALKQRPCLCLQRQIGVAQCGRFRQVRRNQGRQGQQRRQRLYRVAAGQRIAVAAGQYRIEQHGQIRILIAQRVDQVGNGGRIGTIADNANLDRGNLDLVDQCLRLLSQQVDGYRVHGEYAIVVLHRQRRDHGQRMRAECRDGADVGLDAGAAAGVGTGKYQHARPPCLVRYVVR